MREVAFGGSARELKNAPSALTSPATLRSPPPPRRLPDNDFIVPETLMADSLAAELEQALAQEGEWLRNAASGAL